MFKFLTFSIIDEMAIFMQNNFWKWPKNKLENYFFVLKTFYRDTKTFLIYNADF